MSEETTMTVQDLRRIARLLERIHGLAAESSRRGMLEDGNAYLIQQYQAIVANLAARGHRLPDYFPELGADATLGTVGFASAQAAEYLLESIEAAEAARGEGAAAETGESFFDRFFSSGEFQHIGEAMREAMPEWLRTARKAPTGSSAKSEAPRAPSSEGASTDMDVDVDVDIDSDLHTGGRLAELSRRIQEVAARMRQPDLPPEELQRLAAEVAQLGEQQARLVQEAASGRSI
jgi:hypothetical protein